MEATSIIHIEGRDGEHPKAKGCTIKLGMDERLHKDSYFITNMPGSPNDEGCMVLLDAFIHGIATTIRHGHEHGFFNESEKMRQVIEMLGKAFAMPTRQATTHDPYEFPNKGA